MSSTRHRRGQATVELALFCIVIVPVILYTLFLHDLLRYKLDLIETVTTAPWDYTTLDFEKSIDVGGPARQNRRSWCDHTTAYNSYDIGKECDDLSHHEALSAHACWKVQGAQQVQCSLDKEIGKDGFGGDLPDGVNKGGRFYCSAALGVVNYFLPQQVLMSFSQVATTRTKEMFGRDDNLHRFGAASSSSDQLVLERVRFSLVADTWAMTTVKDVNPNENTRGVLYDRAGMNWDSSKADKAKQVGDDLIDDEILNDMATQDMGHRPKLGDDPTTHQVGFSTAAPPDINGNHASPWQDWASDKVEATYNKRGSHYMGAQRSPQ